MFRNLFLAALAAAICAGLATSAFQAWRVTPLILVAETYEGAAPEAEASHQEAAQAETPAAPVQEHHAADDWAPQDGFERTAFTVFSNIVMSVGYALILGAVALVFKIPLNRSTGLFWGLAGFAAFSLAPSLGLPPGMPGMPVADTFARQLWWAGAAVSTGAAFILLAKTRAPWAFAAAAVLILAPQLIAAPQPPNDPTAVPPRLTAEFVAAVLYNGAIFWAVLGLAFGAAVTWLANRSATVTLKGAHA